MKLGVIIPLTLNPELEFRKVHQLGFHSCQLNGWQAALFNEENVLRILSAERKYEIEVSALWCGWDGPATWDFIDGPSTLGLVPLTYRHDRLKTLMHGAEFTARLGVQNMITHVGYIPEDPNHPEYRSLVTTLRYLAQHCQRLGINFLFETGQETPVTLLRTIEDIGLPNVGVNLDPANLILYGKGNPVDALDVIGKYVRDVHAKDGRYPTTGRHLGEETPLGQGKVNFPALIAGLKALGYDGPLTIEREISGDQQTRDILAAKELLEKLI